MKVTAIRELDDQGLLALEKQLRRNLFDWHFRTARDKTHLLREYRRDIARVLTIATERGLKVSKNFKKDKKESSES
ncbi:MAG: 50S ribosomal protein L29 [Deltaproteobacteria bacterium]|jgi:ribosomal protein L29|nr:50S ribosomal protein L29 [Deltaproteobacteria bacterium]